MWQAIRSACAWGGACNPGGDRRSRPDITTLAAHYDRAAAHWQARYINRLGFQRAYVALCERLVADRLLPSAGTGARVLDCGIGTGAFSAAFAAATGIRDIDGVDISPRMLRQANRRLQARQVHANLCRADIHRLPYASGTFNAVLCSHLLEHLPAPWFGIRELARVLRPGGTLAIIATRANPVDAVNRFRWRYAPLGTTALNGWLSWSGMAPPRRYSLGSPARGPFWLSRAVVAVKPACRWHDWSAGGDIVTVAR